MKKATPRLAAIALGPGHRQLNTWSYQHLSNPCEGRGARGVGQAASSTGTSAGPAAVGDDHIIVHLHQVFAAS